MTSTSDESATTGNEEIAKSTVENGVNNELSLEEKIEKGFSLPLDDLYRCAIRFFRQNDGKAFHASYDDRNKLVAYTKQVAHGKYADAKSKLGDEATEAGFFDVVGNDRIQVWESLGDLNRAAAMAGFVSLLDAVCPQFRLHVEAQKREEEEKTRKQANDEQRKSEEILERRRKAEQESLARAEEQRRQIEEALNRQTYPQFRAYAEQQFPNSPEQQHALIRQLQEQHYQQYMAQVYTQQMMQQQEQNKRQTAGQEGETASASCGGEEPARSPTDPDLCNQNTQSSKDADESESGGEDDHGDDLPSNPDVLPASMWTRKDIKEFKESIRKEGSEGIIKVGHGETVTVRVPTHDEGTCLFWEFSTDNYDIGFGVYFEWTISETNTVSVHISESDDEDEEDYESEKGDLEKGGKSEKDLNKPQQDEIIPVYRRDCHEEVYAGSHVYPGKGVYLLKFDNSYSLWRSKCLYYRVYYSK